ncbi:MAG: tRNA preQ1(34) S-adenosylmethionine ribosyltransferase-isomerase QueA [Victivallaceae bacterium]|nr:tRNA preQ1(34) S-adenosylmethionine ribosyltransferase-isomerase QueA [Victivallaceae bacterium]
MLATSLFDYELPDELIARFPAEKRDGSRMMVLDRTTGKAEIHPFGDIVNYLSPGDILVRNNTKVLSGRMYGRKVNPGTADPGAKFELLLVSMFSGDPRKWHVLLKPGKRAAVGTRVVLTPKGGEFSFDDIGFVVDGKNPDGTYSVTFDTGDIDLLQERFGSIPLPPYLRREAEESDKNRYQTVYAKIPGAVAAPTAGLHFTEEVLARLLDKGVGIHEVTLHVGPGTFVPVESEDAEKHRMHSETFVLPKETANAINFTHRNGHRVLAVGTTSVRTLESCASEDGTVSAASRDTDIFLYPPYKPRAVDMLLTNFHLPKSTLLMLVSCFCDREKVLAAYELAKKEKMRFYSYGDCMLLK